MHFMDYRLWMILLDISNNQKIQLIKKYKSEKNIYDNFESIINEDYKLFNKFNKCKNYNLTNQISLLTEKLKKNNIKFIVTTDEEYPPSLLCYEDRPYVLFYKGNIALLKSTMVSFVGARKCTNYGIEVAKILTNELVSNNITIISGGAKGIDSVAHKTAILGNGNTIAVLGCGIDICYPKENVSLFKEIEKKGLIISEFLPGTPPFAYNFPRRNRIISGLSKLTIVIEASKKSGSLITARLAAEQGKDVMVVPGSIFSNESKGCNNLISEGALVFAEMEDLYVALNLNVNTKNNKSDSLVERKILKVIEDEPKHIDYIENHCTFDREVLINVLFEMQMKKQIICLPGNYYAKII